MPKVVATAQVKDPVQWEAGFRAQGPTRATYGLTAPVQFNLIGNELALLMEFDDLEKFKQALASPATTAAMESDGVLRETVKMFYLDKSVED